ncbi:MAG: hypothetical protein ONB48_12065 [candidate division KSB1 bacterium]|nr:hypothetical protein [candidate division KSB1 bacterium]MDZ7274007.1 hypothetical protein [candidate division KSB1 bacterium]MDZ7286380.1 hypothetical protein [candidate division KSB1 bacterium]MDZ7296608.1 hypothetical protein [candidate division KSB1 bacterium]MDZ7309022.1 hypothetical protein [candidate division KSB1 bacterium]
MKRTILLAACAAWTSAASQAQEVTLAEIRKVRLHEIKSAGFVLDQDQTVQIEAVGALGRDRGRDLPVTAAWILDAQTRQVVWQGRHAEHKRRNRRLLALEDQVNLPAGQYELYVSSFYDTFHRPDELQDLGDAISHLFDKLFMWDRRHDEYTEEVYEQTRVTIKGRGRSVPEEALVDWHRRLQADAILAINNLPDGAYERRGFTLERPMEVRIYALGELRYEDSFDYGWIINQETRQKVWQFSHRDSEHGGGDMKNRLVNTTLTLPGGSYLAYYVTDDSHSSRCWNAAPPYDPAFWGMMISPVDPRMKAFARTFEYEEPGETNVIVRLTRAGDDDYLSKGFTLKKPLSLRIYALGEGRDGEMFDYGWITEAGTGRTVWQMDFHKTDHAGGNSKNRMSDEVQRFAAGSYIAHYVTDGTHSYREWNASPPFDPEHWGLTLSAVDEDFNPRMVTEYLADREAAVLAQLIRVRQDEKRCTRFRLDKSGMVRLYALGEGRNGEMFDFGWITEVTSRRTVWEMTYRMTVHAGGSAKNRLFNDSIWLKAGEYDLCFTTDDSHSFGDWNAPPPPDAVHYGITVYRVTE